MTYIDGWIPRTLSILRLKILNERPVFRLKRKKKKKDTNDLRYE